MRARRSQGDSIVPREFAWMWVLLILVLAYVYIMGRMFGVAGVQVSF